MFTEKEHGIDHNLGAEVRPLKREIKFNERMTHKIVYEEIIIEARKLGWVVDDTDETMNYNGPTFERVTENGITRIWQCKDFWQCADIIDNRFQNHRPMNFINELIERERE